LTFEPVTAISSPLLKLMPISSLEWLGAHVDVNLVISALNDQFSEVFPGSQREQLYFIHYSFGFCLCMKVILGKGTVIWLRLLRERRAHAQEQK
jgi:hypothetical protein